MIGERLQIRLSLIFLFLVLLLASWQFLFSRPIVLPDEPYGGIARFIWLDSINLYLSEGKILMFPRNTIIQDVREVRPKSEGYPFIVHTGDQRLEDVWPNDDQGYPFVLSVFLRLWGLNEVTPATFIKFNYLILVTVGIVSSSFLFLSFKSLLISTVFFYLYLRVHVYDGYVDHHWMIGAMTIFYLSFLIFFLKSRAKFKPFWFGFYFLVAGIANIVRNGDGTIGIFLVLGVLLIMARQKGLAKTFAFLAPVNSSLFLRPFLLVIFCIFIYFLPSFILGSARYFRDKVYFNSGHSNRLTYHGFWNGAFMGLGYVPNPYGLNWDDDLPISFARKIDPAVKFHTDKYNEIMRYLYITYSFKYPHLWLGNLIAKANDIHGLVGWWIWRGTNGVLPQIASQYLLYITLALIFTLTKSDRQSRMILFTIVVSLLVSSLPGLVALPISFYLKGFLAAIFMVFFYLGILIFLQVKDFFERRFKLKSLVRYL